MLPSPVHHSGDTDRISNRRRLLAPTLSLPSRHPLLPGTASSTPDTEREAPNRTTGQTRTPKRLAGTRPSPGRRRPAAPRRRGTAAGAGTDTAGETRAAPGRTRSTGLGVLHRSATRVPSSSQRHNRGSTYKPPLSHRTGSAQRIVRGRTTVPHADACRQSRGASRRRRRGRLVTARGEGGPRGGTGTAGSRQRAGTTAHSGGGRWAAPARTATTRPRTGSLPTRSSTTTRTFTAATGGAAAARGAVAVAAAAGVPLPRPRGTTAVRSVAGARDSKAPTAFTIWMTGRWAGGECAPRTPRAAATRSYGNSNGAGGLVTFVRITTTRRKGLGATNDQR